MLQGLDPFALRYEAIVERMTQIMTYRISCDSVTEATVSHVRLARVRSDHPAAHLQRLRTGAPRRTPLEGLLPDAAVRQ